MFTTFVESTGSEKRSGGTLVSFVLHTVLIIAAVKGTLSAKSQIDKYKEQKVMNVQMYIPLVIFCMNCYAAKHLFRVILITIS